MSKLQAVRELPQTEKGKLDMGRVFDRWIRDYEAGSGDADPSAWFASRQDAVKKDLLDAGFSHTDLHPYDIGVLAYDYYMKI